MKEYFAGKTGEAVRKIPDSVWKDIHEVRLRINRPVTVSSGKEIKYLTDSGQLVYNPEFSVKVSEQDMLRTFEAVCRYSVHSFQREIVQGFITVKGGHRVGFCGTPVTRNGITENIKNISSMNFRIAREMTGCAEKLYSVFFSDGLCNCLLAGAPASGKTTLLRDISRLLGKRYKVSLIDERGELAAVSGGVPQNNIGENTDVFDGYGKSEGISAAIRVMSPQIIICDEIGSAEDIAAISEASRCGVFAAASIHASDMDDLMKKKTDLSCFDKIAFLSGVGEISSVLKRTDKGYA